jgi:predicted small secreted protein
MRMTGLGFITIAAALALGACNTVAGAGEDVAAAGHAVDRGATATKDKLFNSDSSQQSQAPAQAPAQSGY